MRNLSTYYATAGYIVAQPVIDLVTDPVQAIENQAFTLLCNVSALDALTGISWLKDGSALDTSDSAKYSGGNVITPSLTVQSATDSDEGSYQCLATNTFGTGTGTEVTVILNCK